MAGGTVIVGAGHAGGRAAEALRAALPDEPILLVGAETHAPYERPPLSKEVLTGKALPEAGALHPPGFWAENRIGLKLGSPAVALDRAARSLRLRDGSDLPWDRLVIATGGRPRPLPLPGAEDSRVLYLRDIGDAVALRDRLRPGLRLAVVGGGVIGLEVAASARACGAEVAVIEVGQALLGRVAPRAIGDWFAALHRRHGVAVHTGATAIAIEPDGDALSLRLAGGGAVACDLIVAGIGILPNTELAAAAGLEVDDGIVVDALSRTADPDIYAIGDVARAFNPVLGRHVRLETWRNAESQSRHLAATLAGGTAPYVEVPWFWSDQYALNLQVAGGPRSWDDLVWRGDPAEEKLTVIALQDGAVVGGVTVNQGRDMRPLQTLIAAGAVVDRARLSDPGVQLAAISRAITTAG